MKLRFKRQINLNPKVQKGEQNADMTMKSSNAKSSQRNWTFAENQFYVQFLKENKRSFQDETTRRSSKIFLEMSLFLRTKTPEQCRTHHQKVIGKFGTLEKIILYFMDAMSIKESTKCSPEDLEPEKKVFDGYEILNEQNNHLKIKIQIKTIERW